MYPSSRPPPRPCPPPPPRSPPRRWEMRAEASGGGDAEVDGWFLRDFTGMLGGILFTFYQEGSQETVATMVGMALGMVLAHVTRGNPLAVWMAFLSLTVFHMYGEHIFYLA
ncbi:hypothetical protein QJS10_CPA16g00883 [Acorus calamus]|uniref:Protein root UVB sensitive/RUS domain-containing protein n=1 Tax=Acorus calamus TaxID=4465 RepID=A0AAV9CZU4_ACOCL|nr:hypothetical protein QJS10_CPA16g00883 [Acorus calamus]